MNHSSFDHSVYPANMAVATSDVLENLVSRLSRIAGVMALGLAVAGLLSLLTF